MRSSPSTDGNGAERLWHAFFFGFSAVMGAFALVSFEAGRLASAIGDAGVSCLMLSLTDRFPMIRAIFGAASRNASPAELQREAERLRSAHPWAERVASAGWTLLLGSLLLRAFGVS